MQLCQSAAQRIMGQNGQGSMLTNYEQDVVKYHGTFGVVHLTYYVFGYTCDVPGKETRTQNAECNQQSLLQKVSTENQYAQYDETK